MSISSPSSSSSSSHQGNGPDLLQTTKRTAAARVFSENGGGWGLGRERRCLWFARYAEAATRYAQISASKNPDFQSKPHLKTAAWSMITLAPPLATTVTSRHSTAKKGKSRIF